MRQFMFVVVVIAAAFLGGAVVNGPGFRWVQTRLLDYMGLKDGTEIASVDLPQLPSDPPDPRRPYSPSPSTPSEAGTAAVAPAINRSNPRQDQGTASTGGLNRPLNSAHSPSGPVDERTLQGNFDRGRAKTADNPASSQPSVEQSSPPLPVPKAIPEPAAPKLASESAGSNTTSTALKKRPQSPQALDSPASGQSTDSRSALPAPLDPSIGPALLASLSASPSIQPDAISQASSNTIPLETAPRSPSPTSSPISPGASTTESTAPNVSSTASDWGSLRRKMQALGVTHYTIEGQPNGQVVFWCLIPLAGHQAVTQRFEASGEDELHAAQTALRRVALWRATQSAVTSTPAPTR